MPEVCLQTGEIVEVDDDEIVGGVGGGLFVAGAVHHATPDADAADGGDLANRVIECVDERLRVRGREISPRFHQDKMTDHRRASVLVGIFIPPLARRARWRLLRPFTSARTGIRRAAADRWAITTRW